MRRRRIGGYLLTAVILVMVIVFVYSGFRILESTVFSKQDQTVSAPVSKTIIRDGVKFFPRQDIDTYLLMGIDRFGPVEGSNSYNNDGEADTVMILIFDQKDETASVLALNRDTMVEMPVLGLGGKEVGTATGQLALAHTYGSGLKDSCENVRKTVENLLYGFKIDHYMSMNMDGIAILNDAVGGVPVTVTEDFSEVDPTIPMGETVLMGDQAISYVRLRKGVGDQMNVSRMDRQKQYVDSFLKTLKTKLQSETAFAVTLFEEASPYLVTDCSTTVLSSALEDYADYSIKEIVTPTGVNRKGETYMEFYADEDALDELILRMFYAPK